MRLIIITSHPIQYNAPFFKLLSKESWVQLKVLYTWGQSGDKIYDQGFKQEIQWDLPLLEEYEYEFLKNSSRSPGTHHFFGIINLNIIDRINSFNPDALLIYGWNNLTHISLIFYFSKTKLIFFRGDSTMLDEDEANFFKRWLRRLVLSTIYRRIDFAFFVGKANKDYFEKHGVKPLQLLHVPHSVDNYRFSTDNQHKEEYAQVWRNQLGMATSALVFLFVGKFEEKKDPTFLLEVFMRIPEFDAYLLFVGNGHLVHSLKSAAKNDSRVLFLPFQNQTLMPIVYRLGDIIVLPSKGPGETWGLVINEAFACRRPAIVSNKVGCVEDLIVDGQTGWSFKNGDNESLANCLNKAAVMGKNGLRNMGNKAFNLIQNWSYERGCGAIKALVESLEKSKSGNL